MASDSPLVAITGANGTIGYASALHALRKGHRVRCVVRREEAIATISAGPSLQQFAELVEYAVVPDNTMKGAYDAALIDATYVVHIAGVWPKPNYHPDDEIYYPFVKSMENVLSAAEKAGTVRRIVFTQAGAALVNPNDGDTLGTAMDKIIDEYVPVNEASASFRPPLATSHHAYCGAKAYCMTYLNSLQEAGTFPFSIVQVIPGTVIGPSELNTTASDASARMDRMSRAILFNDPKPRYAFGFVHVDDCAAVHIEALDEEKVPDSELPDWFIAAASSKFGKNGDDIWKEAGDAVEKEFQKEIKNGLVTVGRDNVPVNIPFRIDSRMTERMLLGGRKFRGLVECVTEVGHWYKRLTEEGQN
ncbi:NAD(P)-binding protein [Lentithecium fluviatile CBS 122367]|uniref:NAD(P)-binding protein n=1 Tax=Lentithecium fluviatile CBS 122367 TaxID=1168545 RepID=A0A6G1IIR6_9PLEO|nr:NAD(P)-binding protein [Lentithecium fluviatile CBS 122367]